MTSSRLASLLVGSVSGVVAETHDEGMICWIALGCGVVCVWWLVGKVDVLNYVIYHFVCP